MGPDGVPIIRWGGIEGKDCVNGVEAEERSPVPLPFLTPPPPKKNTKKIIIIKKKKRFGSEWSSVKDGTFNK